MGDGYMLCDTLIDDRQTSPLRVLCIDDDPEISRIIQLRLSGFNTHVDRAFHGMQGHWLAMKDKPDVIIMDLGMPRGDGEYVLECLQRNEETQDIPVIVLSGRSGDDLPNRLMALGASGFLRKPCRFDELFSELSRFIELKEDNEGAYEPQ